MRYPVEKINAAKSMFLRHIRPDEIAASLNIGTVRTVYQWAQDYGWRDLLEHETPIQALERRFVVLVMKENKTTGELQELSNLVENLGKLKKLYEKKPEQPDDDKPRKKRDRKEKPVKNDISGLTAEDFEKHFVNKLFGYQQQWRNTKNTPSLARQRFYLKSRQIGATYYFAGEAFEDAVLTGDNQIFISASRSQAEIFRAYIIGFAKEWFGIELSGNPIVLSNGAELHFLSTNCSTAQGYHGHVYYDEVFWTQNWTKLQKLSSGMAMQKKYRKTYFSTPSTKQHGAYPLWSGEKFNDGRKKKADISLDDAVLKHGTLGADGIYRQVVTIEDAIAGGCDLFDLDALRLEYSTEEFNNLLMCQFIDGTHGVFQLDMLEKGMIDAMDWRDVDMDADRPLGNLPVWIGYDPSRTTDNAAVVVIAPPLVPGGKFRLIEKLRWLGKTFKYQAKSIEDLCARYNVDHISMDVTGMGLAVFELVHEFFPAVTPIHYTIEAKNGLVLKALDVFQSKRFEYDAMHTDVAQAFMCIRRATTPTGQVTFVADRTEKNGHADIAFAIMHALYKEPLNSSADNSSTWAVNS